MAFTGSEDHSISLEEASQFTANFRKTSNTGEKIGGFFGAETFKKILDQAEVVGIRYYYGKNDDGRPVIVLCGVDANGDDLYQGELAEASQPCPPYCSEENPLNS